jgi:hypothetical protein
MFLDENASITKNNQKDLVGLRISAVLLVLLGGLFGFYVLFFTLLLGVNVFRHLQGYVPASEEPHWFLGLFIAVCTTSALAYLCIRAAKGLRDAQGWAAYVATGFGLLLLLFSGTFIYDVFHPERQGPDEYFLILFVPFCIAIGLWWCVYLNLPHVRAHFKSVRMQ